MAQSRRTSSYTDLLIILGRMPWWINLAIALVSWILLHEYSASSISTFSEHRAGGVLTAPMFRHLAMYAQYLLPLGFLCAAAVAVLNRLALRRQSRLFLMQDPAALLSAMGWPAFVQLLEQTYKHKGYRMLGSSLADGDGSCDLLLQRSGERYLVYCRHWRASRLGVAPLREFFTRIVAEGAAGGFVIITGEFCAEARAFAAERQLELVDGARLQRWILAGRRFI